MALNNRNNNNLVLSETNSIYKWIVKLPFREWKRRPRMGRVQGGARAAFATLSWGPARKTYFIDSKKDFGLLRQKNRFF